MFPSSRSLGGFLLGGLVRCPHILNASRLMSSINDRISSMVKQEEVVVFMKGVPDSPRCGFSNAVVQILKMHDVKFQAHDVLKDEEIRQGEKGKLACRLRAGMGKEVQMHSVSLCFVLLRHQGLHRLADHPSSVLQGRVCRWVRHTSADASKRGTCWGTGKDWNQICTSHRRGTRKGRNNKGQVKCQIFGHCT